MFEKIKEILIDYLDDSSVELSLETTFMGDLDLSSLDVINLVVSIEEEFGVEIEDERISTLTTVGSVIDYLEELDNS